MKYLSIILLLISTAAFGQKTYVIPADSTKLTTVNGTGNELIIENDTRDTLGVLYNRGGGRTDFRALRLQQLTDSTFRLLLGNTAQGQTITIRGTGNFVPYTGATGDVDLGANTLNAESLKITGVNGDGHLHLRHQASDAAGSGNNTVLFANSSGDLKYKNDNLYYTTYGTSGNTADRTYRFPDSSGTVALLSNVVTYSMTKKADSIVLTGSNGARFAVRDTFAGGGGANIYNSDGIIDAGRRSVSVDNSTLIFVDSTHASGITTLYNTFSIGDSSALISRDLQVWFPWNGTKTTVLYYNPTAGRVGTATIGAAELNGSIRSQVSTYNENAGILSGIVSVIDTATMLQTTDFTYSDNGTGEYITMQLTGDSGFVVDPVVFDGDAVFSVRDTASRDVLSVRPGGKVFVDAPVNNGVTKIIGWDGTDSTLTVTDMPGGAAADPDVALIETINVVAGVTDYTIEFDSLPTKYKSFKIEFNNVSALGDYAEAFNLVMQLGTSGGYREYGYVYNNTLKYNLIDGTGETNDAASADTSSVFSLMKYNQDQDTSYSMSGTIDIINPFTPTVGARTIKSSCVYFSYGSVPNVFQDEAFGICKNLGEVTKIKIVASSTNNIIDLLFAMQTGTFRLYGYK